MKKAKKEANVVTIGLDVAKELEDEYKEWINEFGKEVADDLANTDLLDRSLLPDDILELLDESLEEFDMSDWDLEE